MRALFLGLASLFFLGVAQEIVLVPVDPARLGEWAQVAQALRLYPTSPGGPVHYEGPTLATQLWGEIALGHARYALLLGVTPADEVGLWVDKNGDRRLTPAEKLSGTPVAGGMAWSVAIPAVPEAGSSYDYPLQILWPAGRGYVFLVGGAARSGTFHGRTIVVVDADLNGVFGTKGDFLGVDVDGDGKIYAEPDGHERFSPAEAFTLGETSYKVEWVAPGGQRLRLSPTAYVPPKIPLIPGSPPPDFSFRNFLDGKELSLRGFRGKVVLLDFWATWCTPCIQALPMLIALYKEFHAQGLEIVGVSLDVSAEALRQVITAYGISWPVAFEGRRWDNTIANLYRVQQIPTIYLLDKNGVIRFRDLKGEELRKAVRDLLAEPGAEPGPKITPSLPPSAGPILEVLVPTEVGVRPAEESVLVVRVVNTSAYLAEGIRIGFINLPAGLAAQIPPAFDLPAFGERIVEVGLNASDLRPEAFPVGLKLSVNYYYCIGDTCFQMVQEAKTTAVLGPVAAGFTLSPWWILLILGAGVLLSWFLFWRKLTGLLVVLVVVAGVSLAIGIYLGQARQAQRIASVLCTSCVGIEEVKAPVVELSPALQEAFRALSRPVHLVVFSTPWCRACPYAKAVAAEIAALNPRISVELVDADQEREKAEAAGIVRDGKAIVPAVLIRETGAVLFGTTDLADRILAALRGAP